MTPNHNPTTVRAAAERIKNSKSFCFLDEDALTKVNKAARTLADAYLAANRGGEEFPVTADWLRSLPGMVGRGEGDFSMPVPNASSGQIYFNSPSRIVGETDWYLHYSSFGMASVPLPDIYKTRASILKLFAGLGIEAKEPSHAP